MTKEEVNALVLMIKNYYPMNKIFNNGLEVLFWQEELKDFDNDLAIKVARNICENDREGYKVNLANIKGQYYEEEYKIKQEKEEREKYIKELEEDKYWQDNPEEFEKRKAKVKEYIQKGFDLLGELK